MNATIFKIPRRQNWKSKILTARVKNVENKIFNWQSKNLAGRRF